MTIREAERYQAILDRIVNEREWDARRLEEVKDEPLGEPEESRTLWFIPEVRK